jgi:putative Mn2+ efflux pump MntP
MDNRRNRFNGTEDCACSKCLGEPWPVVCSAPPYGGGEGIDRHHGIAFVLLAVVGGRMINAALWKTGEARPIGRSLGALMTTAIGTSLDAMAIGVSLAFLNENILVIAVAIGLATFVLSAGGTLIGRYVGERLGRFAEAAAGLALFLIGLRILIEHLTA